MAITSNYDYKKELTQFYTNPIFILDLEEMMDLFIANHYGMEHCSMRDRNCTFGFRVRPDQDNAANRSKNVSDIQYKFGQFVKHLIATYAQKGEMNVNPDLLSYLESIDNYTIASQSFSILDITSKEELEKHNQFVSIEFY